MRKPKPITLAEFLTKFGNFGERMFPDWDSCQLELFSDGSGSVKYRWRNHPFDADHELAFQSTEELLKIIT